MEVYNQVFPEMLIFYIVYRKLKLIIRIHKCSLGKEERYPTTNKLEANSIHIRIFATTRRGSGARYHNTQQGEDAPPHKAPATPQLSRVLLPPLLRVPLVAVLLFVPLRVLPTRGRMTLPWLLIVLFAACQAAPECKNCVVLESCADQQGDNPEDLAWNLFRCGYDKKAVLFHHMPGGVPDNEAL
ncbi:jg15152 [Pararge aegeria aegeria]|uniref:Jg15152 protein n=1 Tax=Pararge aegeria aegeria TaxID=348720 RepID=A0A8S4S0L9_9NEOP|nr:jg15152 [Pararge aegeria aegeria]